MASETEHLTGLQVVVFLDTSRRRGLVSVEEGKGRPSSWLEAKSGEEVFGSVVEKKELWIVSAIFSMTPSLTLR